MFSAKERRPFDAFWKKFADFEEDDRYDAGGVGRENACQPTDHFEVGAWGNIAGG